MVSSMRMWLLILGFGLAVWAQSQDGETRTLMHYDGSRRALIISGEAINPGDRIEILDLIGRRVRSLTVSSAGSVEALSIPLTDLPEGLYYVRYISEHGRVKAVRRFAVSR